ncbi:MAG TPA: FAD-dependent oxidoreductase, partial [Ktedonobacterales bacterium]
MTTKQAAHTTRIASAEQAAARYRTPARERYDLVILGGGAGGLTAASIAVALHAKVALIDRERLGGECLNTGCVPSKALLHVARVAWSARRASQVGLSARLDPVDFAQVAGYV